MNEDKMDIFTMGILLNLMRGQAGVEEEEERTIDVCTVGLFN